MSITVNVVIKAVTTITTIMAITAIIAVGAITGPFFTTVKSLQLGSVNAAARASKENVDIAAIKVMQTITSITSNMAISAVMAIAKNNGHIYNSYYE